MYFDPNIDNPGPGAYRLNYKQVLPASPKYTMGLNNDIWFDYDKPGPGTYNLREESNTSPKHTMATHLMEIVSTNVPGPGTYNPLTKHTKVQNPKYTIQGPTKYDPYRMIPGPGTYDVSGDLGGPAFSMGKRVFHKASTTPGPGQYNPDSPSSAPAYSVGVRLYENPYLTPGPGTYNVGSDDNSAPAFTMGERFIPPRYKIKASKDNRHSAAVKQRPPHRSAGNTPVSSRAASRFRGAQTLSKPASTPLRIELPSDMRKLSWTRPSTWDITAPVVQTTRPRPLTSSENILRRIHYRIGPTQDAQYNEYIREMYRYMGNKGVRYGHVAKSGTSKSFLMHSYRNKSFINRQEM